MASGDSNKGGEDYFSQRQPHVSCLKEREWGIIEQSLKVIEETNKATHGKLNRALEVVFGKDMNGGIVTQSKLNAVAITQLKEDHAKLLKYFWAIILLFLSTAVKVWFFS